jgi:hypothetical protein
MAAKADGERVCEGFADDAGNVAAADAAAIFPARLDSKSVIPATAGIQF